MESCNLKDKGYLYLKSVFRFGLTKVSDHQVLLYVSTCLGCDFSLLSAISDRPSLDHYDFNLDVK